MRFQGNQQQGTSRFQRSARSINSKEVVGCVACVKGAAESNLEPGAAEGEQRLITRCDND